ncbi:MAG: DUF2530 domain-containing protein [Intrasporangium sp.]|uniref:DUF2530 domain-containing protein n=1 Tax=Intrasporangium sp. TaxID=1925024 RepID=UPI003F7F7097
MTTDETPTSGPPSPAEDLTPVHVPMVRIVEVGMLCWLVALFVVMLVPALHTGDKAWWPWCCVAGFGLGGIGLTYVRRGRGNAADA